MSTLRAAAIHDLSGFGRCSLTVALPILSAMGVQCCPLPTAFLSTHTGGFEGFTFLDMTDEMEKAAAHWKALGLRFDAIYSGFLGSARQIGVVERFFRDFRAPGTLTVVDPVMGDPGAVYKTYTSEMCAGAAAGGPLRRAARAGGDGGAAEHGRAALRGAHRRVPDAGKDRRHVLRRENGADAGGADRVYLP